LTDSAHSAHLSCSPYLPCLSLGMHPPYLVCTCHTWCASAILGVYLPYFAHAILGVYLPYLVCTSYIWCRRCRYLAVLRSFGPIWQRQPFWHLWYQFAIWGRIRRPTRDAHTEPPAAAHVGAVLGLARCRHRGCRSSVLGAHRRLALHAHAAQAAQRSQRSQPPLRSQRRIWRILS